MVHTIEIQLKLVGTVAKFNSQFSWAQRSWRSVALASVGYGSQGCVVVVVIIAVVITSLRRSVASDS